MRAALAIGIALVAIGYLVIYFGALVLDDVAADREAGEDQAHDAETVQWIRDLREPVTVTPTGDGGMDALLGQLLFGQMVPAQRQPGES